MVDLEAERKKAIEDFFKISTNKIITERVDVGVVREVKLSQKTTPPDQLKTAGMSPAEKLKHYLANIEQQ